MNNQEMNNRTRRKWIESLIALEDAGKTDSAFYRRALAIAQGRPDPGWIHPRPPKKAT
jgi:hypothetical protein